MATVTLGGNPVNTIGTLPQKGEKAKDFTLIKQDLSEAKLSDFAGKNVILNVFPSVDTPTCATSVRAFNKKASELDNTVVLCISKDLPFAFSRFCAAEGLDNVVCLSDFQDGNFGKIYGLEFTDSKLKGLHSRAVIVINPNGEITHAEQVAEIANEPNYDAALAAL